MRLGSGAFMAAPPAVVAHLTLEHLFLVSASTALAAALGVPLGIFAAHRPQAGRVVVAAVGGLQVVPSLALFGLLLPVPVIGGIGQRSAIVALVLYGLLPIVRGTTAAIGAIDPAVREAAVAMGMTDRQILRHVELPLGLPVILAGVRTALTLGVGVATVAAAIGAGGLGTLIFRGLRMNDNGLVVAGAVPAALLALCLDGALAIALRRGRRRAMRAVTTAVGFAALIGALALASRGEGAAPKSGNEPRVTVCTKDFSEQVVLGEILAQGLEARGVAVTRRFELGGSLCHEALAAGTVDVYPEYTGTAYTELLHHPPLTDADEVLRRVRSEYAARGIVVAPPLGFANDFVLLVREGDRARLGLRTLTDLGRVAGTMRAGFGQDFVSRADGYAGLVAAYGLRFAAPPREMDLSLTYRALADGQLDLIAGDSTNGLIEALGLAALEDDRHYFPPYQAVFLARSATLAAVPALAAELDALAGALPTATMRRLNRQVEGDKVAPAEVAAQFRAGRR